MNPLTKAGIKIGLGLFGAMVGTGLGVFGPMVVNDGWNERQYYKHNPQEIPNNLPKKEMPKQKIESGND